MTFFATGLEHDMNSCHVIKIDMKSFLIIQAKSKSKLGEQGDPHINNLRVFEVETDVGVAFALMILGLTLHHFMYR